MLSLFDLVAILLVLTASFAWVNHRFIHLPHTIGLLIMGLASSLVLVGLQLVLPDLDLQNRVASVIRRIDFQETVLGGMLAFLLFAGSLHVDLGKLRDRAWVIGSMATLGVLISTAVVGLGVWGAAQVLGIALPLPWALVFGALISPTDPVAVLSTLRVTPVPEVLKAEMTGESLFNDGVGVVIFTALLAAALGMSGEGIDLAEIGELFVVEALGGALLGLVTGYLAYRGMRAIDDYAIEVLISLALVTGSYAIADQLHISGPIAVVVAGVFIGNRGPVDALSGQTERYLFGFWTLTDEILNSLLFLLIGLEVIVLRFEPSLLGLTLLVIPIVLCARLAAVAAPVTVLRVKQHFVRGTIPVLTWGGLRGGISVALALSIPENPYKAAILAATYAVVLFSIIVQGLTLIRVIHRTVDA
ncbi:cation:proton antiporter [Parvularcula dongshanensis]|uniref:CPA1 family monovalent cation:H+ antiporter n=1 Tax=Parvularcula dongshanensis TaxID=1173995 RepID=A0A840I4L7_9PROT|nr:sodium:proton antiporter [Parvularcula dongshanensis]MBB4659906.1 CPA1 family monovalent cation:H+ antiporter [Parvularcula dongshanensis]